MIILLLCIFNKIISKIVFYNKMFITNINITFVNISLKNFLFIFFINNFLVYKFHQKSFKKNISSIYILLNLIIII